MTTEERRKEISKALLNLMHSSGFTEQERADKLAELLVPEFKPLRGNIYVEERPTSAMAVKQMHDAHLKAICPETEQAQAEAIWLEVLEKFKAPRPSGQLSFNERKAIAESIKENGLPMTMAALKGRQFEEKTQSFDPGKHLSIDRTFQRGTFDKMVNLSAQHKAKMKAGQ